MPLWYLFSFWRRRRNKKIWITPSNTQRGKTLKKIGPSKVAFYLEKNDLWKISFADFFWNRSDSINSELSSSHLRRHPMLSDHFLRIQIVRNNVNWKRQQTPNWCCCTSHSIMEKLGKFLLQRTMCSLWCVQLNNIYRIWLITSSSARATSSTLLKIDNVLFG